MNELITQYAMKAAQSITDTNVESILAVLSADVGRSLSEDEAALLTSAIKISLGMGVAQVISILCSDGVLQFSEDDLRRYLLTPQ